MQRHKKSTFLLVGMLLAAMLSVSYVAFAADKPEGEGEPVPPQYAYISNRSVYFYDVDESYPWAVQAVDYLAAADVVRGTDNYLFEPDAPISRADFVLMLYRAYDMSEYRTGQNFPDVPAGAYYADAVLAAKNLGIASGDGGKFLPDAPITREDAMVLLARTVSRAGMTLAHGSLGGFTDAARVSGYAQEAAGALVRAGVVSGDEGGLRPAGNVSRAEMAVMLYRVRMLQQTDDGVHYKAHPERINLCIGDQVYSGVTITNYDGAKDYEGLVAYTSFRRSGSGHEVELDSVAPVESQVRYENGTLFVDGVQVPVAETCVAIQTQPYSILEGLRSTGQQYRAAAVSYNADGEADIIYYMV
ncbi:S-layer homology domain-containing protein [Intestinibacillus massiliensis]|nr:S-layer homology domain-containing protein [Intestinibacillus massiliensis]